MVHLVACNLVSDISKHSIDQKGNKKVETNSYTRNKNIDTTLYMVMSKICGLVEKKTGSHIRNDKFATRLQEHGKQKFLQLYETTYSTPYIRVKKSNRVHVI